MARRYRPRKEFKFWLYHDLPDQVRLMDYIDYLRKTRQFATIIRNGLRLMWTLSEGDTSVLQELFPGVIASLKASNPPSTPGDDFNKLLVEAARQGAQIALLEAPANIPEPPAGYPAMKHSTTNAPALTAGTVEAGGIKTMNIPQIAMPTFDDDEQDTVIIRRDENALTDIAANLFASIGNMQNMETSEADAGRRRH